MQHGFKHHHPQRRNRLYNSEKLKERAGLLARLGYEAAGKAIKKEEQGPAAVGGQGPKTIGDMLQFSPGMFSRRQAMNTVGQRSMQKTTQYSLVDLSLPMFYPNSEFLTLNAHSLLLADHRAPLPSECKLIDFHTVTSGRKAQIAFQMAGQPWLFCQDATTGNMVVAVKIDSHQLDARMTWSLSDVVYPMPVLTAAKCTYSPALRHMAGLLYQSEELKRGFTTDPCTHVIVARLLRVDKLDLVTKREMMQVSFWNNQQIGEFCRNKFDFDVQTTSSMRPHINDFTVLAILPLGKRYANFVRNFAGPLRSDTGVESTVQYVDLQKQIHTHQFKDNMKQVPQGKMLACELDMSVIDWTAVYPQSRMDTSNAFQGVSGTEYITKVAAVVSCLPLEHDKDLLAQLNIFVAHSPDPEGLVSRFGGASQMCYNHLTGLIIARSKPPTPEQPVVFALTDQLRYSGGSGGGGFGGIGGDGDTEMPAAEEGGGGGGGLGVGGGGGLPAPLTEMPASVSPSQRDLHTGEPFQKKVKVQARERSQSGESSHSMRLRDRDRLAAAGLKPAGGKKGKLHTFLCLPALVSCLLGWMQWYLFFCAGGLSTVQEEQEAENAQAQIFEQTLHDSPGGSLAVAQGGQVGGGEGAQQSGTQLADG